MHSKIDVKSVISGQLVSAVFGSFQTAAIIVAIIMTALEQHFGTELRLTGCTGLANSRHTDARLG